MGKIVDFDKARNWVIHKSKPPDFACPICKSHNWSIDPELAGIDRAESNKGEPYLPYIVLTCSTCGYTMLINAVIAGFAEASSEPGAQSMSQSNRDSQPENR